VVLESGVDAGIYTVRRVLTWTLSNDTLVLDRPLITAVSAPSGLGDGSGLRYRLDDSLQIDIVDPKVQKVPLGTVFLGNDLGTVAGSANITVGPNTNFLLAGVAKGDTLEINEGLDKGKKFIFSTVSGTTAVLETVVPTTGATLKFLIYKQLTPIDRPLVRVSEIEVLDSSNQPTGNTIPYGKAVDCRTLGKLSNRADGKTVESFAGATTVDTVNFQDATKNFTAEGVIAAHRLEILEGKDKGEYEVASIITTTNPNDTLVCVAASLGGSNFLASATALHYLVGQPSTGIARLYFANPTTVEVDTGLTGGRLEFKDANGSPKAYRFSEVDGTRLFPVADTDDPRDLRLVRSYGVGAPNFESILEITDNASPASPNAYDLELQVGDVVGVHTFIPFKEASSSNRLRLDEGIFGEVSGLRTITGSARVTVAPNSDIDFTKMGPSADLSGQIIYIEDGPDIGKYTILKVVDAHTLDLDALMTATTAAIKANENPAVRDAVLVNLASGVWMQDATDIGSPVIGEYITIFEAGVPAIEGSWRVAELDLANDRVRLDAFPVAAFTTWNTLQALHADNANFTWVLTDSASISGTIEQHFKCYETVAKDFAITQVASRRADVVTYQATGSVSSGFLTQFNDATSPFALVNPGDKLEVLEGVNRGFYFVDTVTAGQVVLHSSLASAETGIKYRVWSGVYGSKRMVTVGDFEGSLGAVGIGSGMPYAFRRPKLAKLLSTDMQTNFDGALYYMDLAIESLGPGDDRNIDVSSRLTLPSGVRVDGYTYVVENNVLTFSPSEEVTLSLSRRFLPPGGSGLPSSYLELNGQTLKLTYDSSTAAGIVDDLLRSNLERVVCANPLGRHMLPSYVYVTLNYTGGSSADLVGGEIEKYINSLGPLDVLEVSDLEAFITRRGGTYIQHPISLVSVTHDIDRSLIVERSFDKIGGTSVPYNGTARISAFFTTLSETLLVVRS
jgi:hypothetical protein